jgi:hypothetical protein
MPLLLLLQCLFLYGTIEKGGVEEREEKGTTALAWLGRGRYYLIIISVG